MRVAGEGVVAREGVDGGDVGCFEARDLLGCGEGVVGGVVGEGAVAGVFGVASLGRVSLTMYGWWVVRRVEGVTVAAGRAGAGLSRLEHQDAAWVGALEEVPGHGGAGDAAADDDGVGCGGEVGRGSVVGEGVWRVLPVADCWVGDGE